MGISSSRKPSYQRGQIYLVKFPFSDLSTVRLRPALVVQSNIVGAYAPDIIFAQITSNVNRAGTSNIVSVPQGSKLAAGSGLLTDSYINTAKLVTLDPKFIIGPIGKLSDMSLIDTALKYSLGL